MVSIETLEPTDFEQRYQVSLADIRGVHRDLLEAEQEPANNDEIVKIGHLSAESEEYDVLASARVSTEELDEGKVVRGHLLDAGFVFLNRIGGGEKPLISAALPAESTRPSLDLTHQVLLTADELARVTTYQRDVRAEHGIADAHLERIRLGMLGFLASAIVESETETDKSKDLFREAQRHIYDGGGDERMALTAYIDRLFNEGESEAGRAMQFTMQQCMAELDILNVSNVPIEVFPTRFSKLNGQASPFLESGFRLDDSNFDTTLYPNDPTKTRRLNLASIHLLSRGLDEMGTSRNGSHDQTYLTAVEYAQMATAEPEAAGVTRAELVDLVATRLLAIARA